MHDGNTQNGGVHREASPSISHDTDSAEYVEWMRVFHLLMKVYEWKLCFTEGVE